MQRTLVSGDSHVIEQVSLWADLLPADYWRTEAEEFADRPGGFDPALRTKEMDEDAVAAEVLYPSLALRLFGLEDPELQRACFQRYNAWLAEYCAACPERLIGIGLISAYEMPAALEDLAWCRQHGLRGIEIWQTPHPDLPFRSEHYEPLWEACARAGLPVALHILTGFDSPLEIAGWDTSLVFQHLIARKLLLAQNTLLELCLSGVLDRHRDLRIVLVENECAWFPFFVDQLGYYHRRFASRIPERFGRSPDQALTEQVSLTFFRDPNASLVAQQFPGNLLWSSDYPHPNSTWPRSQEVVADRLGGLPEAIVDEVAWRNACRLFSIELP